MKKYIYMAVAAMVVLCSCTNDNDPINDNPADTPSDQPKVNPLVFTASMDDNPATDGEDSRVSQSMLGTMQWEKGDTININGKKYVTETAGKEYIDLIPVGEEAEKVEGKYHAYYPDYIYTGANSGVLPAEYEYIDGKETYLMPMYAESDIPHLQFKNLGSVLWVTVKSTDIDKINSITLFSSKQMNGPFTVSMDENGKPAMQFVGEPTWENKRITVKCKSTVELAEGRQRDFYFSIPPQTGVTLWIVLSGPNATKIMKTKDGAVNIARSKSYQFNFGTKNSCTSCMPGEFSVSDDKKVRFAKSNLYWDNSESKYFFENSPIDNSLPQDRESGHINHFFWSQDATVARDSHYTDNTASGNDYFFCDESHKLTVAEEEGFYCLQKSEWEYVLGTKDQPAHSKYKLVTVEGKQYCWVIAPDGFAGELKDTYTVDELDALGLICMPPTGNYYDDSGQIIAGGNNWRQYYWYATPLAKDAAYGSILSRNQDGVVCYSSGYRARYSASAIRLVK